jgi:hypothetical protein
MINRLKTKCGRAKLDVYRSQNTPCMLWLYAADEATLRLFDDMADAFKDTLSVVCDTSDVMLVAASFVTVYTAVQVAKHLRRMSP